MQGAWKGHGAPTVRQIALRQNRHNDSVNTLCTIAKIIFRDYPLEEHVP